MHSNCQVHVHRASHRAQHCNAFRSVASQDIKTALGLPSGIKLGQYNALAAFTASPTGPGRKVTLQFDVTAWHSEHMECYNIHDVCDGTAVKFAAA